MIYYTECQLNTYDHKIQQLTFNQNLCKFDIVSTSNSLLRQFVYRKDFLSIC